MIFGIFLSHFIKNAPHLLPCFGVQCGASTLLLNYFFILCLRDIIVNICRVQQSIAVINRQKHPLLFISLIVHIIERLASSKRIRPDALHGTGNPDGAQIHTICKCVPSKLFYSIRNRKLGNRRATESFSFNRYYGSRKCDLSQRFASLEHISAYSRHLLRNAYLLQRRASLKHTAFQIRQIRRKLGRRKTHTVTKHQPSCI